MSASPTRRQFLQAAAAAPIAAALASHPLESNLFAAEPAAGSAPQLKFAVKYAMIHIDGSIKDKFELVKKIGFQGVEFDSPSDVNRDKAVAAQDETGVKIHGVIDSVHWKDRLSDPDAAVRAKGIDALKTAIADAKLYGATSVLLVPGAVRNKDNENFDQCWSRSHEEIRKVLPLVKDSGARLAIEVVWNDFITKPEQLVKYIDEFSDPCVGAYFDCSNMVRYGVPDADWIRALGPRLVKFDFKGFSKDKFKNKENPWVPIGDGDEDWPGALKALAEIGYSGWATAEVEGGGEKELRDVKQRMDRVLGAA